MIRTQVYLTEEEKKALLLLSEELGIQQSSLIRTAIDLFIEGKRLEKRRKRSALSAASGLWANRHDLPDFEQLRKELDTR